MRKKIPYNDIEYVRYQAEQLESMIKQRSHCRRVLIKFIKLNRNINRLGWYERYLKFKCDSTLIERFRDIVNSMGAKTPE